MQTAVDKAVALYLQAGDALRVPCSTYQLAIYNPESGTVALSNDIWQIQCRDLPFLDDSSTINDGVIG